MCKEGIHFLISAHGQPDFPTLFVKQEIISPLPVFVRFVKDRLLQLCGFASEASVLFQSLFWYQYHAFLITVAFQYNMKSSSMMPSALFFFLRIVLAMQALFWFHMKFKLFFSSFVKRVNGSLMGIAMNLSTTLGSMDILMISLLPNREHGMFFTCLCPLLFPRAVVCSSP